VLLKIHDLGRLGSETGAEFKKARFKAKPEAKGMTGIPIKSKPKN
jgi:hypothetical protein